MILAAPLVIPFAEAIGLSVATLGIAKASDMVNEYIQENPEQSMKIFQMIMPSQGIANALKNKSSEGDEEVQETEEVSTGSGVEEKIKEILVGEGVDIEGVDLGELPKDLQGKVMKGIAKSSSNKQKDMKEASAIIGLSGPARETKKMADEIDDRYEGGLEEVTKTKGYDFRDYIPKGAYKKRYADGGAIGIEVLFEPKRDNFRKGGDTMGGKNDKSKTSKGPDRSAVGPGSTYANNVANQNDGGGGINNTINNINKPTVFDKVKNTVNKVVDNPLTTFLDPRSKLALAMGGYRYLRDGVTPFQQKSIDDELESIQTRGGISPYADGGRVGLFMGGSPLTGQALSIYNSMKAYNFSDQEIANALTEQGLYTPVSSTPDTPQIASPRNIINQGGDGGITNSSGGPTFNRNDLLGTPDYFPAEPFSFKDTVSDIGDYIKSGGIIGAGIRGLKGLFSRNTKNYVTTPQIKARDRVEAERIAREEAARQEAIRQEAYAQARQDRETYRDLEASITSGQGGQGFDRPSSGPTATGAGMGVGGGYASDYGFKDGGLVTMFKKKR